MFSMKWSVSGKKAEQSSLIPRPLQLLIPSTVFPHGPASCSHTAPAPHSQHSIPTRSGSSFPAQYSHTAPAPHSQHSIPTRSGSSFPAQYSHTAPAPHSQHSIPTRSGSSFPDRSSLIPVLITRCTYVLLLERVVGKTSEWESCCSSAVYLLNDTCGQ